MALRDIVVEPNEVLRRTAKEVKKMTPHLRELIEDMKETMYAADGVGIAAPQVGVQRRIAIVDIGDGPVELINPVLLEQEGEQTGQEGCLSCPEVWGIVRRPEKVKVQTMDGIIEAEGFLARAICHEMDHLDGRLFIDIMDRQLTEEEIRQMSEDDEDEFDEEFDEEYEYEDAEE